MAIAIDTGVRGAWEAFPADGIHLEVAAGTCILADVPPLPDGSSES